MNKPQKKSEPKVDEAVAESFPASDPPSYMGSSVAGAPKDNAAADMGEVTKPVVTAQISVDLNKATEEELGGLTALSPELVRELIANRPFTSWEDVKELSDFDGHAIAALKKGGAFIGY
jgi:DNA uptake protein ComE-like DNA-binding protein